MSRSIEFATDEYYHVYNRGTEKRDIFLQVRDYFKFLESLKIFNDSEPAWKTIRGETSNRKPFVEVVAYCLNPNHYHLILKQKQGKGISEFMRKLGTGYTMYFNKKYDRSGVLFQGNFKAVHIDSNEYLLYVSAYVNCNSEVHGIMDAVKYRWCSFSEFISNGCGEICTNKGIILGQFKNKDDYKEYAKIQATEMKNNKEMQRLALE